MKSQGALSQEMGEKVIGESIVLTEEEMTSVAIIDIKLIFSLNRVTLNLRKLL